LTLFHIESTVGSTNNRLVEYIIFSVWWLDGIKVLYN
jgi:hypothetical protein